MKYQRAEKSAVSEHVKNCRHEIQFDKVKLLNKEARFGKLMDKEIIEMKNVQETTTGKIDRKLANHDYRYTRKKQDTQIKMFDLKM